MSTKGPKSKDTNGIKFFKIDPEGDIAPAFPRKGEKPGESAEAPQGTFSRIEPVFDPESGEASEPTGRFRPEPVDSTIQDELDRLQPQVEDISRLSKRDELKSDQIDVLRKYISLKEAEARDLKDQQRQYQSFVKKLSTQFEQLTRRNRELLTDIEALKRREESLRNDLHESKERHLEELGIVRSEFEDRLRRSGNYQSEAESLQRQREEWKEKVREDLKRIKLKERELENKYELLKRDTQALLDSKDKHVLELKKKNDAFELEMESLEERLRKSNVVMGSIDSKKKRLVETMKLAISLLEAIDNPDSDRKP